MQDLLDKSCSYSELLDKVGLCAHGSNRITLRKIINEYDLDLTKIDENRKRKQEKLLQEHKKIPKICLIF